LVKISGYNYNDIQREIFPQPIEVVLEAANSPKKETRSPGNVFENYRFQRKEKTVNESTL
jgi:hypothetical protein